MNIKSIRTSNTIIPWMLLIALIPMLLICYLAYSISNNILSEEINHTISVLAKKKIETIDVYINERKLDAFQLSNLPSIKTYFEKTMTSSTNKKYTKKYLADFLKKAGFDSLLLIEKNGGIIFSTPQNNLIGQNVKNNVIYNSMFNNAMILMLPYVAHDLDLNFDEKAKIYIATPVFDGSMIKGVLLLSMSKNVIKEVIKKNMEFPSATTYIAPLIDGKIKLFAASNEIQFIKHEDRLQHKILGYLKKANQGQQGMAVIKRDSKSPMVVIFRYLPELAMGILTQYDSAKIYEQEYWLKKRIVFLAIISVLIVLLFTLWISYHLRSASQITENALLNILPSRVIDEIKDKGYYTPRILENVSIIFADIVGFSDYALRENSKNLTSFLSEIYMEFDKLADKYHINKIKTIGDAYMGAADSEDAKSNARNAINFALAVIKTVKIYNIKHDTSFDIRVGVNTGKVMSGVISGKKISYDIWGNNVNIAWRMQEAAPHNHVLITQLTYDFIPSKEEYSLSERMKVTCKGVGDVYAYSIS
jgi:class 3 adenylate cyclase